MQSRFSQRHGFSPVKESVQIDSMSSNLRNCLWNALDIHFWQPLYRYAGHSVQHDLRTNYNKDLLNLCVDVWINYFRYTLDSFVPSWGGARDKIQQYFFECPWYEVYDFVEFMAQPRESTSMESFRSQVNSFLQQEASGYRLVQGKFVPIADQVEIEEMDTAVSRSNEAVSEHLRRSLDLLSNRLSPDYRNSVKESISAVEGQVRISLGSETGTLGDLLKKVEIESPTHPAIRSAFRALYGYTSDESGIRHALIEGGREVSFEEAKFMLVACSAFVNYVRGVATA